VDGFSATAKQSIALSHKMNDANLHDTHRETDGLALVALRTNSMMQVCIIEGSNSIWRSTVENESAPEACSKQT
jgi:hypothetical protein